MNNIFPFINSDILFILIILLILISIGLIIALIKINKRLKSFLVNVDAHNISDSLAFTSGEIRDLQKFRAEMETYMKTVEARLQNSVQSVNTIRFNPFKGTGGGGNQSFATAFLNEKGDGVIISSLYSRDRVSVFAKPIKANKSEYELSDEEKEAINGQ